MKVRSIRVCLIKKLHSNSEALIDYSIVLWGSGGSISDIHNQPEQSSRNKTIGSNYFFVSDVIYLLT